MKSIPFGDFIFGPGDTDTRALPLTVVAKHDVDYGIRPYDPERDRYVRQECAACKRTNYLCMSWRNPRCGECGAVLV